MWRCCCVERSLLNTYALCTAAIPELCSIHDSSALHRHSPCKQKPSRGRWNNKHTHSNPHVKGTQADWWKAFSPTLFPTSGIKRLKIKSWAVFEDPNTMPAQNFLLAVANLNSILPLKRCYFKETTLDECQFSLLFKSFCTRVDECSATWAVIGL